MKYRLLLACLVSSFLSGTILADGTSEKFCADKDLRNPAYGLFMKSTTMKYKIPDLYTIVDHQLDDYFAQACFDKKNFLMMKSESIDVCIKVCDRNADSYTSGKMFGKKELGREIFNECASVCHAIDFAYSTFNKGLEVATKNSNDCANPSKDSISTIGRSMKEIQNHHSVPGVKSEVRSK